MCCRPYFTVWVTSIQIIIFLVTVSVYGIAPINVHKVASREVVGWRSSVITTLLSSYATRRHSVNNMVSTTPYGGRGGGRHHRMWEGGRCMDMGVPLHSGNEFCKWHFFVFSKDPKQELQWELLIDIDPLEGDSWWTRGTVTQNDNAHFSRITRTPWETWAAYTTLLDR